MKKLATFKKESKPVGLILVILQTKSGNLVGELYEEGKTNKHQWVSRATFYEKDFEASEYEVMKYFNFTYNNSKRIP